MATIESTVRVHAPPHRVFEAITDLKNAPSRVSAIKRLELLTDGPMGVGTRFRETRVMFGREASETMEVTRFDPGRSYDLFASSCGCEYRSTVRVDAAPGGASDLTMTFDARPVTFSAKVMSFLMNAFLRRAVCKAVEKDLSDIKAAVEGVGAATGGAPASAR